MAMINHPGIGVGGIPESLQVRDRRGGRSQFVRVWRFWRSRRNAVILADRNGRRREEVITVAGMGPAPKPEGQRRRRNAPTAATTRLPAEGRTNPAPRWPLGDDIETAARLMVAREKVAEFEEREAEGKPVSEARMDRAREAVKVLEHIVAIQAKAEKALWRELWRTPMAAAWERDGYTREVAQYVRWKVHAENGNLDAAKEARQLGDRIGLTPLARLRLRWEVAADELAEVRERRSTPQSQARVQARMHLVDPAAVGQ
jgi:hypothetical protein